MNCENADRLISERLEHSLSDGDERALNDHLGRCERCRAIAAATTTLWSDLEGLESVVVPHERMRARFHAALAIYDSSAESRPERAPTAHFFYRPLLQAGLAAAMLVAGIAIGRFGLPTNDSAVTTAGETRASLALLEHPSASERLRGVAWAERDESSEAVLDALIATIRNDPNVNVRLAAVEAVSLHLERPGVGEGLITALEDQQSPLMQVALAEVLLAGGVDGSPAALRRLSAEQTTDPTVREFLQAVLQEQPERNAGEEIL